MKAKSSRKLWRWFIVATIAVLALAPRARMRRRARRPATTIGQEARPTPDLRAVKSGAQLNDVASVTLRDEQDRKVWEFRAGQIEVSEDRNVTHVRDLKEGTYFRDGKATTTFTADEVHYDAITKQLELRGHVTANDKRGLSIAAPYLAWNPKERKFVATDNVTGSVQGLKFATRGMQLWPDAERAECANRVEASTDTMKLASQRLSADLKTQRVELGPGRASVIVKRIKHQPRVVPPVDPVLFRRKV